MIDDAGEADETSIDVKEYEGVRDGSRVSQRTVPGGTLIEIFVPHE